MRRFITLVLVSACGLLLCTSAAAGPGDLEMADGPTGEAAQIPEDCAPAPGGGYFYDGAGFNCPCDFDSYWDVTGGRSPVEWAGICGYGYECHTWNARAEYLLWFSRGRNTRLATTFLTSQNGQQTGTRPLFGDEPLGENARSGLRLMLGRLLADGRTTVEGRFWGLEDSTERFGIDSSRLQRLGVPIFDVTRGDSLVLTVANPGDDAGGIDILSKGDLFGGDAWLRREIWNDGGDRLELLAGYQFARLDDSVELRTTSTLVPGSPSGPGGTITTTRDSFVAQNEFHGGTLGFIAERRWRHWSLEVLGKLGLGSMRESVIISGQATQALPGNPPSSTAGGIFAMPSNSGSFERHDFAVVPELNANFVFNISPSWRLLGGYSILYWDNAVLAGDQIDIRINNTQTPGPVVGPRLPAFAFNRNDYVVQGMNFGAEYRW